ncbi:MAG: hypothetical protein BWK76_01705 [Desulfobulbaceae bacterium A2]|nr:MAG: hypothetical protein BWK76_01705 [Desulfobulbaceae bacterium A2]
MFRGIWRTIPGLLTLAVTVISATLMLIALILDQLSLVTNPYFAILAYMILPTIMVLGMVALPLVGLLCRRGWFKTCRTGERLYIDLGNSRHRRFVLGFTVLSVFLVGLLLTIAYEGYHFTDSSYFCGMVCHRVMEPEYTAAQRSAHAKVSCVSCHIGPGAQWFVRAKISGLRQVKAMFTNDFSRPIPAPVEHLRPARDTCETCHWPEKFHGKKVKSFISYSNDNQTRPEKQDIALHIGGRNPRTEAFEGIHWHVSHDVKVEYQSLNSTRTQIGAVRVSKPGGITEMYELEGGGGEQPQPVAGNGWRTMDCIDCHNRPTHVYDRLQDRVDFGLSSGRIDPSLAGIREDAMVVLRHAYASRQEAKERLVAHLMELQVKRHGAEQTRRHEAVLHKAGAYLLDTYLRNVWPEMKVGWGTYKEHLGHRDVAEGYGCFRCHDEEHRTVTGKTISQDCALCHDEP